MGEYLENNDNPDLTEDKIEAIKQFRRAQSLVLNDAPAEPVDAVLFHPLSYGDDDEMFPLAARLVAEGKANYIVINGSNGEKLGKTKPGEAWAGKDEYIRRLKEHGLTDDRIVIANPAFHTRQNNDVFLEAAKNHGWKSAVTLNQPQQLLRATLGQIKTMKDSGFWMRLYATYPEPWDAAKKVYGSQGEEENSRWRLLLADFERILAYQAKGDLASFDDFFDYMDKRPKIR